MTDNNADDGVAPGDAAYTLSREDVLYHLRELGYAGEDISDAFIEECIRDFNARGTAFGQGAPGAGGLAGQGGMQAGTGDEVAYLRYDEEFEEPFEESDDEAAQWNFFPETLDSTENDEEELDGKAMEFKSDRKATRVAHGKKSQLDLDEEVEDAIRYFNTTHIAGSGRSTAPELRTSTYLGSEGRRRLREDIRPDLSFATELEHFTDNEENFEEASGYQSHLLSQQRVKHQHPESFDNLPKSNTDSSIKLNDQAFSTIISTSGRSFSCEEWDNNEGENDLKRYESGEETDSGGLESKSSFLRADFEGSYGRHNQVQNVMDRLAALDLTEVRRQIERQKEKLRKAIDGAERERFGEYRSRQSSASASESLGDNIIRPPPEPSKRKKHDPVSRFHEIKSRWEKDKFVNRLDPKNTKITITKSDVPTA
ncbi:hypothetical protein HDU67_002443 [Dinochytrium kinnereticum]|nr:hypothetical protein HDU67_002443 [Dinochytrium kinnereticum]